jgi:NADPH2:quinone reductase
VVLDMVAGDYVQRNIDALAMDGRLVMIGRQGGVKSEIDIMPILRKRLVLTGSTLRTRSIEEKGALANAVHQHVWPLFESGAVQVIVHQTFPLRDAASAHRVMESSAHVGKLVLQVHL